MKTYLQVVCLFCLLLASFACARVSADAEDNAQQDTTAPMLVNDPDAPTHEAQ